MADAEEKEKIDREAERARAVDRFWQTHDLNPLTQRYYDKERVRVALFSATYLPFRSLSVSLVEMMNRSLGCRM